MKYLFGLTIIFLSTFGFAQELKTADDTFKLCSRAAEAFGSGDVKASMNFLKPYWPLPAQEIDNLTYQTDQQLQMVASRFGNIVWEFRISL